MRTESAIELSCQLLFSPRIVDKGAGPLWATIQDLHLPVRAWSADAFDDESSDSTRAACLRGERLIVAIGGGEWIVSSDRATGSVGLTGDLIETADGATPTRVSALLRVVDALCESLDPRFGWADHDADYPRGLVQNVMDSRIGWIFWLNYFGGEYASAVGKSALMTAPFHAAEEVGNGVRCLTSDWPSPITSTQAHALRAHFAPRDPDVEPYWK